MRTCRRVLYRTSDLNIIDCLVDSDGFVEGEKLKKINTSYSILYYPLCALCFVDTKAVIKLIRFYR